MPLGISFPFARLVEPTVHPLERERFCAHQSSGLLETGVSSGSSVLTTRNGGNQPARQPSAERSFWPDQPVDEQLSDGTESRSKQPAILVLDKVHRPLSMVC
jgi:hypothetical protein